MSINDNLQKKHLILLDTSYITFYRFHATRKHYNLSYPEEIILYPDDYNWLLDKVYMNNFNYQFNKFINELPKKLGINSIDVNNSISFIWAIDCPNKDIWRHNYIEDYKGTRKSSHIKQKFHCYEIFPYVYDKILEPLIYNDNCNLRHKMIRIQNCEADDIIAQITLEYNLKVDKIYIIGSDTDYLQICDGEHIALYDIMGIKKQVKLLGYKYLLAKIMCGDASDNISSCKLFRCSMKSIENHLNNSDKMKTIQNILDKINIKESKLISNIETSNPSLDFSEMSNIEMSFYKNMKVIDFKMIPEFYKNNILMAITRFLKF